MLWLSSLIPRHHNKRQNQCDVKFYALFVGKIPSRWLNALCREDSPCPGKEETREGRATKGDQLNNTISLPMKTRWDSAELLSPEYQVYPHSFSHTWITPFKATQVHRTPNAKTLGKEEEKQNRELVTREGGGVYRLQLPPPKKTWRKKESHFCAPRPLNKYCNFR